MPSRQTIKKITPNQKERFDAQFWPVVVALVVLSGITFGAILTLLRGPWMWGSLLALPILVAITIVVLQRLNNRQLRRALQFAIVISMAIHMLILVFASVTDIFSSTRTEIAQETRKRPQRVILTNRKNEPRIWEKITRHEVADQEVKVQQQTATNNPPQPIPIKSKPSENDQQVSKTAERSQTVPRFDESLSQLHSSTNSKRRNNARNTPMTSPTVSETRSKSTSQTTNADSAPSEAALTAEKRSTSKPSATRSTSQPAPESDSQTAASKTAPNSQRAASRTETPTTPSRSTARLRRSQTNMPKTTTKSSTETAKTSSSKSPAKTSPQEVTESVTQRESKSIADRRSVQDTLTKQSSTSQREVLKSVAQRRDPEPAPPSISDLSANPVNPKRSRRNEPKTASTKPIEAPSSVTRANNSGESRMQPTAASVTQQRSVAVGSEISRNVGTKTGSSPSTATRASDTASRKETTSAPDATLGLTATQRSKVRRSVTNNRQVESAFKSNTTMPAKLIGSRTPAKRTATAAATLVDSASTQHRKELSAEKGQANLDIGPTKIVTESVAQNQTGGGGQPIVDDLQLEPVSKTRVSRGSSPSTLDAQPDSATMAQNESNSKPTSATHESPTETRIATDRRIGSESLAGEPTQSLEEGPTSDRSESAMDGLLAQDRKRRTSDNSPQSKIDDEDEKDDLESLAGNSRRRLAQAPSITNEATIGLDESSDSLGTAGQPTAQANDSLSVGRALSNLAPTAGRLMTQAAISLPLVETGSSRSTEKNKLTNEPGESNSAAATPTETKRRSQRVGKGPALPDSPTDIAGSTPNLGENKSGTDLAATETTIQADRGEKVGTIELQIAATPGPAGLTEDPSTRLGVRARPASRESDDIQSNIDTRFKRKDSGAKPGLNPDAVIANEAFQARMPNQGGGGPSTEAAIELGLEFLIRHQNANGSWSLGDLDTAHRLHKYQLNSDAAATGLTVIAFQGAGYNHREFKYALQLNHAIEWLIAHQSEDGCLYVPSDENSNNSCMMYSHSIATLALTEAYGMTQDVKLRKPIEKAIAFIEKTQDTEKGGWRYFAALPNGNNSSSCRSTDTSVTGWMLMALQSARLSGFEIKPRVFERIRNWLDIAQELDKPGEFRYDPYGKDKGDTSREEGRRSSPAMTSVGLLMRLYLGWNREDDRFQSGVDYLLKNLPSDATIRQRDTYYWYYATQVMRHAGGEKWQQWNQKLHPLLVSTQEKSGKLAGSWHPYLPVPDRWGGAGGRIYVTTMNLLSLEVNYRLLPLYEDSTK